MSGIVSNIMRSLSFIGQNAVKPSISSRRVYMVCSIIDSVPVKLEAATRSSVFSMTVSLNSFLSKKAYFNHFFTSLSQ